VAEVEQLWSMACHVLPDHWKCTQPVHVEALLFLKINKNFWDESMVEEALSALHSTLSD
jgi:hypothetical protein